MDKAAIQEALVSNFAALLGAKAQEVQATANGISCVNAAISTSTADDFNECLSEAVESADIVCTLPSMEMKLDAKKDALPGVGNSFSKFKPEMAASVLASQDNADNASHMEKEAGKSLGTITSWTRSTLVYAPHAASKSISESFSSLVSSRVRAWTLLLLRHSLTTGDAASRTRLLSMLSSNIEILSTMNSFKTLPLPDSARSQPKEADVILPLLFECKLQIVVQGKNDSVFLRAPGTIAGHFASGDKPGLLKVDVRLDTNSLLESMVEQARLVVFKAVARATSVNVDSMNNGNKSVAKPDVKKDSMSTFSSALNLSADAVAQSPSLQKARSSALRLNSILQGKSNHGGASSMAIKQNIRKNRSVQWDHGFDGITKRAADAPSFAAPPPKRQRLVQSQARLRSFKSFGRPHGGDGGSEPRNATFGDFGRAPAGPVWGRDGKLIHHPRPGMVSSRLSNLAVNSDTIVSNQNATFDAPPKRMKRTATALESWLVDNATGRI